MVSTSEADWTEYECPPTDVAAPAARSAPRQRHAGAVQPPTRAVTSTGARLTELGDLLVDLESQIIAEAQQRTWEQCRHHWRQRVHSLVPGEDACRRLSLLLLGAFERGPSKPTKSQKPKPPLSAFSTKSLTRPDADRPPDDLNPRTHPHPRTRADLEASLLIDAQHESWIDTHRRHWVRRCKDLAGLDENLEDDTRIRSARVLRLDVSLSSYSVLALGLFGGIRTDALRRIAEGGWDADGCREWNRRIRLIMDDDEEEPEEPEPTPVPSSVLRARELALARESLESLRRLPRRAPDARDEAVAAAQRTATRLERDYLDDGAGGLSDGPRDSADEDDSYNGDDSYEDEEETTAAVAGTNLTREILHESPHYRQLVEHYRRRMGEPGYDPDASDDEDDPIRDSLVAATVRETVGLHEGARRRLAVGHDGAHGLVTATRASRGAEANVAARAAVAAREVYAAAGLPFPTRPREGLGFREAHRFAGVPYPADIFPTGVAADNARSEDDRAGRLLARRLVERERLVRATGDFDAGGGDEDGDDDAATVAPSPPSLTSAPIDEAGVREMDERDLRAALMDTARRLEAAQDELLCQICFTERRDALIMPCLHLLYCRSCVDRSSEANERRGLPDRCPCCRASVGGVLRCKRL